jgi:hypothetical protein
MALPQTWRERLRQRETIISDQTDYLTSESAQSARHFTEELSL